MSAEHYQIWAYWRPRAETAQSLAHSLAQMFVGLAATHPVFARWNQKADTRKKANAPFCSMPPRAKELTEICKPLLEEHSVAAWNGIDHPRGISFHAQTGFDGKELLLRFSNTLHMDFPVLNNKNADFLTASILQRALLSVVAAWQPDWASVSSSSYWDRMAASNEFPIIRSGWMTYLSAPYAQKVTPPPEAIVIRPPGGGILVLATDEPFTVNNPAHVTAADAIQRALEPLQADPFLKQPVGRQNI